MPGGLVAFGVLNIILGVACGCLSGYSGVVGVSFNSAGVLDAGLRGHRARIAELDQRIAAASEESERAAAETERRAVRAEMDALESMVRSLAGSLLSRVLIFTGVAGALLNLMLLVAGIGLLCRARWGRTLSMVAAVLLLVLNAASALAWFRCGGEFTDALAEITRNAGARTAEDFNRGMEIFRKVGPILQLIVFSAYPIVLLGCLSAEWARRAFDPDPPPDRQGF